MASHGEEEYKLKNFTSAVPWHRSDVVSSLDDWMRWIPAEVPDTTKAHCALCGTMSLSFEDVRVGWHYPTEWQCGPIELPILEEFLEWLERASEVAASR